MQPLSVRLPAMQRRPSSTCSSRPWRSRRSSRSCCSSCSSGCSSRRRTRRRGQGLTRHDRASPAPGRNAARHVAYRRIQLPESRSVTWPTPTATTTLGGAAPSSTRSTCAASPTATATASATWPASAARLPYLADLGVDAIWFNPWYPSPLADGGYDVADYRDIDPVVRHAGRGRAAHRRGARARHPDDHRHRAQPQLRPSTRGSRRRWRPGPGSPERERFWFRAGPRRATASCRRTTGVASSAARPGPASTRRAEWYLHLFAPSSPTSTGTTPTCARSSRTSCGSGSTAASTASASTPPRCSSRTRRCPTSPTTPPTPHPYVDRDELHDIYRSLAADRRLLPRPRRPGRRGVAARRRALRPLPAPRRAAHRVQLRLPGLRRGTPARCARRSTTTLAAHAPVGAPATWVLSNHDVTRHGHPLRPRGHRRSHFASASAFGTPTDLGARHPPGPGRRAAHPGPARLGLPLPGRGAGPARGRGHPRRAARRTRCTSAPAAPTRAATAAGCRCPGPGTQPPFGFSPAGAAGRRGCRSRPTGRRYTVEAQAGDPASMLELYREALRLRRAEPGLGDGPMTWLERGAGRAGLPPRRRLRLRRQPRHRAGPAAAAPRGARQQRAARRGRHAARGHRRLAAAVLTHATPRRRRLEPGAGLGRHRVQRQPARAAPLIAGRSHKLAGATARRLFILLFFLRPACAGGGRGFPPRTPHARSARDD